MVYTCRCYQTVEDAKKRLEYLEQYGPAAFAFVFRKRFSPPGIQQTRALSGEFFKFLMQELFPVHQPVNHSARISIFIIEESKNFYLPSNN